MSSTWDGLDERWSWPPKTIMFPLLKEDAPTPNELFGLIPNVRFPPELEPPSICCEKLPLEEDNWSSVPFSSPPIGAPKEFDCSAESSGPPTLKKFAVSPMLSKDWLNNEKEGAMSMEPEG